MADKEYTITIPGISDIIRINWPDNDDKLSGAEKDAKIERYRRFIRAKKAASSPMPEAIQWIPDMITRIDNAQDFLTTALTLAKPLIRRVLPRVVPALGWVLLANDVMNLATWALGKFSTPINIKRSAAKTLDFAKFTSKGRIGLVKNFMRSTNWFSFGIQAAQVTEDLFGVGLRLGPIMGLISDGAWGAYRFATGATVNIDYSAQTRFIDKAGAFLTGGQVHRSDHKLFSAEEHKILLAAENIAAGELLSISDRSQLNFRPGFAATKALTPARPTSETLRRALHLEGIPITGTQTTNNYLGIHEAPQGQAMRENSRHMNDWQQGVSDIFGKTSEGTAIQFLASEASQTMLEYSNGPFAATGAVFDLDEKIYLRGIHWDINLPTTATLTQIAQWVAAVKAQMVSEGSDFILERHLITARAIVF